MADNNNLNGSKNRSYELKKLKAQCVAEENKRFLVSQRNRRKGTADAVAGNTGLKSTKSEVYILLVCKNETESVSLQEQFKSTRIFKKTKPFADMQSTLQYIKQSRFAKNSIIIIVYAPEDENSPETHKEFAMLDEIKKEDPNSDVILVTSNVNAVPSGSIDFCVPKHNEYFSKIVTNITWAIREQERIRKQVESKQFIKMAIIIFVMFFVLVFAIDFVSGILSPMRKGLLGIVPIPQP